MGAKDYGTHWHLLTALDILRREIDRPRLSNHQPWAYCGSQKASCPGKSDPECKNGKGEERYNLNKFTLLSQGPDSKGVWLRYGMRKSGLQRPESLVSSKPTTPSKELFLSQSRKGASPYLETTQSVTWSWWLIRELSSLRPNSTLWHYFKKIKWYRVSSERENIFIELGRNRFRTERISGTGWLSTASKLDNMWE